MARTPRQRLRRPRVPIRICGDCQTGTESTGLQNLPTSAPKRLQPVAEVSKQDFPGVDSRDLLKSSGCQAAYAWACRHCRAFTSFQSPFFMCSAVTSREPSVAGLVAIDGNRHQTYLVASTDVCMLWFCAKHCPTGWQHSAGGTRSTCAKCVLMPESCSVLRTEICRLYWQAGRGGSSGWIIGFVPFFLMPLQNVAFVVELTDLAFWCDLLRFWLHLFYLLDVMAATGAAIVEAGFAALIDELGSATTSQAMFLAM